MWAWHNGTIQRAAEVGLSLADAGLVFGATVTDFCRTYHHRLFRWTSHWQRFRKDCSACDIPLTVTDQQLTHAAQQLLQRSIPELEYGQELALISVATPGPLGYLLGQSRNGPPTLLMHTFPLDPARYASLASGATLEQVGVLPHEATSIVPVSAKHRSRLAWWLAERRKHWPTSLPCLVNARGQAPDTALASVVLVQEGQILRSPVGTILESVSLAVLEELAAAQGVPFRQQIISWDDLQRPGVEVWLVGSGFGLAGVKELRHRDDTDAIPVQFGPMLAQFLAAWQQLVDAECGGVRPPSPSTDSAPAWPE